VFLNSQVRERKKERKKEKKKEIKKERKKERKKKNGRKEHYYCVSLCSPDGHLISKSRSTNGGGFFCLMKRC